MRIGQLGQQSGGLPIGKRGGLLEFDERTGSQPQFVLHGLERQQRRRLFKRHVDWRANEAHQPVPEAESRRRRLLRSRFPHDVDQTRDAGITPQQRQLSLVLFGREKYTN